MEDKEIQKTIARGIQFARKKQGWKSARVYSEHLGIPYDTYVCYEQGKRSIPIDVAWLIADDLGISLDKLFGRDFHE